MYDDDECETCDRTFVNQLAAIQHMDALDHWEPQFECETCDKRFWTQPAANQHMDAVNHHKQHHWPRL
jgi:hypothetical protein